MYWDNNELTVIPYNRKQKHYHCGRKLVKLKNNHKIKYVLLVIDLSEAYCANVYEDGDYEKVLNISSSVQSKHRAGGQSQRRFERIREGSITEWYKRINDYIKEIDTDKLYIAINFVYQSRFENHLTTDNKNKIIKYLRPEYGGFTGFLQLKKQI